MSKWIVVVVALFTAIGYGETPASQPGAHSPDAAAQAQRYAAPQVDPGQKLFQYVSACLVDRPASGSAGAVKLEDIVRRSSSSVTPSRY